MNFRGVLRGIFVACRVSPHLSDAAVSAGAQVPLVPPIWSGSSVRPAGNRTRWIPGPGRGSFA